ncbi:MULTISPECIES: hypothetical protein [Streptomyces]|uniref:hypothetical protein n=1 Tax=Streptomyces TaxID=1883 RepID=UPI002248EB68|nr:hypothetical protein [Streptomyces sp. JHD 1]MCX2968187.1 hypothetical protein [Streptomyces sp. JHD 1]
MSSTRTEASAGCVCYPRHRRAAGRIWKGNRQAAALFDRRVHKPLLHGTAESSSDGYAYQA